MTEPEPTPLEPNVARKLDGGLRRLLAMPEPEISRAVRNDRARLARVRRRPAPELARVPEAGLAGFAARATAAARPMAHPVWGVIELSAAAGSRCESAPSCGSPATARTSSASG